MPNLNVYDEVIQLSEDMSYPDGYNSIEILGQGDAYQTRVFAKVALAGPLFLDSDGISVAKISISIVDPNDANPFLIPTQFENVSLSNPQEISVGNWISTLLGVYEDEAKTRKVPDEFIVYQGTSIHILDGWKASNAPDDWTGFYSKEAWVEYEANVTCSVEDGKQTATRWWTRAGDDETRTETDVSGKLFVDPEGTIENTYSVVPIPNASGNTVTVYTYYKADPGEDGIAYINAAYGDYAAEWMITVNRGGTGEVNLSLSADPSSIPVGGTCNVICDVTSSSGTPISGHTVEFYVQKGSGYLTNSVVELSEVTDFVEEVMTSADSSTGDFTNFSLQYPAVRIHSIEVIGEPGWIWNGDVQIFASTCKLVEQEFSSEVVPITVTYDYGGRAITQYTAGVNDKLNDRIFLGAKIASRNSLAVVSITEESAAAERLTISVDPSSVQKLGTSTVTVDCEDADGNPVLGGITYTLLPDRGTLVMQSLTADQTEDGSIVNTTTVSVAHQVSAVTSVTFLGQQYSVASFSGREITVTESFGVTNGKAVVVYTPTGAFTGTYTAVNDDYEMAIVAKYSGAMETQWLTVGYGDDPGATGDDGELRVAVENSSVAPGGTVNVLIDCIDSEGNPVTDYRLEYILIPERGELEFAPTSDPLTETGSISGRFTCSVNHNIASITSVTFMGQQKTVASFQGRDITLVEDLQVTNGDIDVVYVPLGLLSGTYTAEKSDYKAAITLTFLGLTDTAWIDVGDSANTTENDGYLRLSTANNSIDRLGTTDILIDCRDAFDVAVTSGIVMRKSLEKGSLGALTPFTSEIVETGSITDYNKVSVNHYVDTVTHVKFQDVFYPVDSIVDDIITVTGDFGVVSGSAEVKYVPYALLTCTYTAIDDKYDIGITARYNTRSETLWLSVDNGNSASSGSISIDPEITALPREGSTDIYVEVLRPSESGYVPVLTGLTTTLTPDRGTMSAFVQTTETLTEYASISDFHKVTTNYRVDTVSSILFQGNNFTVDTIDGNEITVVESFGVTNGQAEVQYVAEGLLKATYTAEDDKYDVGVVVQYGLLADTVWLSIDKGQSSTENRSLSMDTETASLARSADGDIFLELIGADGLPILNGITLTTSLNRTDDNLSGLTQVTDPLVEFASITGFHTVQVNHVIDSVDEILFQGMTYTVDDIDGSEITVVEDFGVVSGTAKVTYTPLGLLKATYTAADDKYDIGITAIYEDLAATTWISVDGGEKSSSNGSLSFTVSDERIKRASDVTGYILGAAPPKTSNQSFVYMEILDGESTPVLSGYSVTLTPPIGQISGFSQITDSIFEVGSISGLHTVNVNYKVSSVQSVSFLGANYTVDSIDGNEITVVESFGVVSGQAGVQYKPSGLLGALYTAADGKYEVGVSAFYGSLASTQWISVGGGTNESTPGFLRLSVEPSSIDKLGTAKVYLQRVDDLGNAITDDRYFTTTLSLNKGSITSFAKVTESRTETGSISDYDRVSVNHPITSVSNVTFQGQTFSVKSIEDNVIILNNSLGVVSGSALVTYTPANLLVAVYTAANEKYDIGITVRHNDLSDTAWVSVDEGSSSSENGSISIKPDVNDIDTDETVAILVGGLDVNGDPLDAGDITLTLTPDIGELSALTPYDDPIRETNARITSHNTVEVDYPIASVDSVEFLGHTYPVLSFDGNEITIDGDFGVGSGYATVVYTPEGMYLSTYTPEDDKYDVGITASYMDVEETSWISVDGGESRGDNLGISITTEDSSIDKLGTSTLMISGTDNRGESLLDNLSFTLTPDIGSLSDPIPYAEEITEESASIVTSTRVSVGHNIASVSSVTFLGEEYEVESFDGNEITVTESFGVTNGRATVTYVPDDVLTVEYTAIDDKYDVGITAHYTDESGNDMLVDTTWIAVGGGDSEGTNASISINSDPSSIDRGGTSGILIAATDEMGEPVTDPSKFVITLVPDKGELSELVPYELPLLEKDASIDSEDTVSVKYPIDSIVGNKVTFLGTDYDVLSFDEKTITIDGSFGVANGVATVEYVPIGIYTADYTAENDKYDVGITVSYNDEIIDTTWVSVDGGLNETFERSITIEVEESDIEKLGSTEVRVACVDEEGQPVTELGAPDGVYFTLLPDKGTLSSFVVSNDPIVDKEASIIALNKVTVGHPIASVTSIVFLGTTYTMLGFAGNEITIDGSFQVTNGIATVEYTPVGILKGTYTAVAEKYDVSITAHYKSVLETVWVSVAGGLHNSADRVLEISVDPSEIDKNGYTRVVAEVIAEDETCPPLDQITFTLVPNKGKLEMAYSAPVEITETDASITDTNTVSVSKPVAAASRVTFLNQDYPILFISGNEITIDGNFGVMNGIAVVAYTPAVGNFSGKYTGLNEDYDVAISVKYEELMQTAWVRVGKGTKIEGEVEPEISIEADPSSVEQMGTSTIRLECRDSYGDPIPIEDITFTVLPKGKGTLGAFAPDVTELTEEGSISAVNKFTTQHIIGSITSATFMGTAYEIDSFTGNEAIIKGNFGVESGSLIVKYVPDGLFTATYTAVAEKYDAAITAKYLDAMQTTWVTVDGGVSLGGEASISIEADPTTIPRTGDNALKSTITLRGKNDFGKSLKKDEIKLKLLPDKGLVSLNYIKPEEIKDTEASITSSTTVSVQYTISTAKYVIFNKKSYPILSWSGTNVTLRDSLGVSNGKATVIYTPDLGYFEGEYEAKDEDYDVAITAMYKDLLETVWLTVGAGGSDEDQYELSVEASSTEVAVGKSVDIKATLKKGGNAYSGQTIVFNKVSGPGTCSGSTGTNREGQATLKYTIPAGSSAGVGKINVSYQPSYKTAAGKKADKLTETIDISVSKPTSNTDSSQGDFALPSLTITGKISPIDKKFILSGDAIVSSWGLADDCDAFGCVDSDVPNADDSDKLHIYASTRVGAPWDLTKVEVSGAKFLPTYFQQEGPDAAFLDSIEMVIPWRYTLNEAYKTSITITDKDNASQKIVGATVSLSGQTATTGPDGLAKFERLSPGEHSIEIKHPNYKDNKLGVQGGTGAFDDDTTNDKYTVAEYSSKRWKLEEMEVNITITWYVRAEVAWFYDMSLIRDMWRGGSTNNNTANTGQTPSTTTGPGDPGGTRPGSPDTGAITGGSGSGTGRG